MGKIVSYTLDTLPRLTDEDRVELKALADRPDSEIDFSDSPEMTDEQWKNAKRYHFGQTLKPEVTTHIDADILRWLKGEGEDFEVRMNAILRREMVASLQQR